MERVVEKVLHRLAAKRHDPGDVFRIGVHVEPEIDHLLLPAGEAGQRSAHLTGEIGEAFFADQAAPDGWRAVEEVFELGLDSPAGSADGSREVMAKGSEEIVFYKGGFADGKPVEPKGEEEVLDTILDQPGVFCEPGAVVEEVLVVGMHQFAEGIGIAVAELVPEKEIFVQ